MKRIHWLALVSIFVLGLVLQIWDLGSKSMWADEIGAVRLSDAPNLNQVYEDYRGSDQRQPPVYLFLLHAAIEVGGENHISMRLPSALLAALSIPLMAWIAHRMAGPRVAVISSLLLTTSPLVILFGRMVRPYGPALFLTLAATGFLIESFRRQGTSPLHSFGYVVSALLLVLTNYVSVATVIAHNLFFFVWFLKQRRQAGEQPEMSPNAKLRLWLVAQMVLWALFLGWLAIDLGRTSTFAQLSRRPFDVDGATEVLMKALYPLYAFVLGETIFPWHPLAILGAIAFAIVTIVGLRRISDLGDFKWLPPIVFLVTLALTVVAYLTIVLTHSFETIPSRAIGALPFLILVAALGISRIGTPFALGAMAVLLAVSAVSAVNYFRGEDFHNPIYAVPTQEISQVIRERERPGDLIVADEDMDFEYYHFTGQPGRDFLFAQDAEAVRATLQDATYRRVWLVTLGRDGTLGVTPLELEDWVEEEYVLQSTVGFVPQDPTYSRVKEAIQGFPDYTHKAQVRLFVRRS